MNKVYIDLTKEQIEQLRPLIEEVNAGAEFPAVTGKSILAQIMTTWDGDAFIIAGVIPSEMTNQIRAITGADKDAR